MRIGSREKDVDIAAVAHRSLLKLTVVLYVIKVHMAMVDIPQVGRLQTIFPHLLPKPAEHAKSLDPGVDKIDIGPVFEGIDIAVGPHRMHVGVHAIEELYHFN